MSSFYDKFKPNKPMLKFAYISELSFLFPDNYPVITVHSNFTGATGSPNVSNLKFVMIVIYIYFLFLYAIYFS